MAQRIQTLCDEHLSRGEEVDGTPLAFGLGPGGTKLTTYEADLCEVCAKELQDTLARFMELGRKVAGPRKSPTAARAAAPQTPALPAPELADLSKEEAAKQRAVTTGGCPLCDYIAQGSSPSSLRRHIKEVHETTLEGAVGLPTPYQCSDCGQSFSRPQGLALHKTRIHGVGAE